MYTFYFRVCPTGLSATTRAKLIAVKGFRTPRSPELGHEYDAATMQVLVENGHKVVIEPAKPYEDASKYSTDTVVPTMRYAKGYGAPKLRIPEYSDWAYRPEWLWPVGIKVAPAIGPLPPQAPLAPEPISAKVEYHVPLPPHVGETVVGIPTYIGEYKDYFHYPENEGVPLTWYERFALWFDRNFIPN